MNDSILFLLYRHTVLQYVLGNTYRYILPSTVQYMTQQRDSTGFSFVPTRTSTAARMCYILYFVRREHVLQRRKGKKDF